MDVLPKEVREVLETQVPELFTGASMPLKELPEPAHVTMRAPMLHGWWRGTPFAAAIDVSPGESMYRLVVAMEGRQFFAELGDVLGAANGLTGRKCA